MKASIVECSFGVLAFNKENQLIGKVLFPRKPHEAAKIIASMESGKTSDEVVELVRNLHENGYETFVFENVSLAKDVQA